MTSPTLDWKYLKTKTSQQKPTFWAVQHVFELNQKVDEIYRTNKKGKNVFINELEELQNNFDARQTNERAQHIFQLKAKSSSQRWSCSITNLVALSRANAFNVIAVIDELKLAQGSVLSNVEYCLYYRRRTTKKSLNVAF